MNKIENYIFLKQLFELVPGTSSVNWRQMTSIDIDWLQLNFFDVNWRTSTWRQTSFWRHDERQLTSICAWRYHYYSCGGFFFLDTKKCLLHANLITAIFHISVSSRAFLLGRRWNQNLFSICPCWRSWSKSVLN